MKPESLQELYDSLMSYYGATRGEMERADRMYRHEVSGLIRVPDGMAIHESSTASLIVDNLRDQIRTDEPVVTFESVGTSQEAMKMKSLMEMWGYSMLKHLPIYCFSDPFQQASQDLLLRGAACIKFLVDPASILSPPTSTSKAEIRRWRELQASTFPFLVRPLDPMAVFPAPGSRRQLPYILEVQQRTAADMALQYGDYWHDPIVSGRGKYKGRNDPSRPVQWLEYWSAPVIRDGKVVEEGHYMVEADGQSIIDTLNPYGIVPYIFSYSGLGRANYDGDPSHLAVNILSSIVGELEEEVRIKTAQAHQWLYHAYPRLLTTDDPRKVRKQFMVAAGSIIRYEPGQKPEWLENPEPNPSMLQFLQEIMANIHRKVSPALVERPTGVDAGVHQALLLGQALKVISPIRRALNTMGTDLLNGLAQQMAAGGLIMNARGKGENQDRMVKGSDFVHRNFRVEFEAVDPTENDRRMLTGLALRRDRADGIPLLSRRTFMEKYMKGVVESPDDEEVLLLSEAALAQLVASGALVTAVLAEVEAGGESERLNQAVETATGMVESRVPGARERQMQSLTGQQMPQTAETAQAGFEQAGV